ncbi:MAG: DUF4214 domain-containing protein [Actinomycetota bacterium]
MSHPEPTTAQVMGALSSPLPTDGPSLDRRRFLQAAAAAAGIAALPAWLAEPARAATPLGPGDGTVVLITLGGGNDALNTVIPVHDGAYHDARRGLAIGADTALPLSSERSLHPNLGELAAHWNRGDLAIIEGVGVPEITDLSHFSSMARVMAGTAGAGAGHSGWIGRYLDGLGGGDDPFHAVHLGRSIPLVMQGEQRQASGLPVEAGGTFRITGVDDTYARQYNALAAFGASSTGRGQLADALAASGAQAVDLARTLEPHYQAQLPDDELSAALEMTARLINANLGVRAFSMSVGDFDSHAGQPEMHNARMAELNAGIARFHAALDPAFAARTVILIVSEFGRRVRANYSNGTDHGAAGAALVIGTQVRGGLYGHLPSLTNLTRQGNMVPTVDFRSVYATILDDWLGGDSRSTLGAAYENLGFLVPPAPSRTTTGLNPVVSGAVFENRAQVVRLYRACFGRLPDSRGLDHWVDARRAGLGLADAAEEFARSAEFNATYGPLDNRGFVAQVYRNVLGREADAAGLDYWSSVLAGGASRGAVMVQFSESAEFVAAASADVEHVDANGPVARLYRAYFGRSADRDGLRYWIGTDLPYQAVSDSFAGSSEFAATYGPLSDNDFVTVVYRNVMGRDPDAAGRAYWVGQLRSGVSRGSMMLAFSESDEFVAKSGTTR